MCQLNICSKLLHKARKSPSFRKTKTFKLKIWDEDTTLIRYLRQLDPSDDDWHSAAEAVMVLAEFYGARVDDCKGIVFKLSLLLTGDGKLKSDQRLEINRSIKTSEISTLDSSENLSRNSELKVSSLQSVLGEHANHRIIGQVTFLTSSNHSTGLNIRGARDQEMLPEEYIDYTATIAAKVKRPGRWFTGGILLGANLSPKRSSKKRSREREVVSELFRGNAGEQEVMFCGPLAPSSMIEDSKGSRSTNEQDAIFCSPLPPSSLVDSNDLKILGDHTINFHESPLLSPTSVDEIDDLKLSPDDCERVAKPVCKIEEVKELSDVHITNVPIITTHVPEPEPIALPWNRSLPQIEKVLPLSNINDQIDLIIENKQDIDDPINMRRRRSSISIQNNENEAAEQPDKSQASNSRSRSKKRRGKYYYTNMIYPGLKIPGICKKRNRKGGRAKRKRRAQESDEEWKPRSRRRKLSSIEINENQNSPVVNSNHSLNIEDDEAESLNEQGRLVSPDSMSQSISTEQIKFPEISIIPRLDQPIFDVESEPMETGVNLKAVNGASGFFNIETESWVLSESEINESSVCLKPINLNLTRLKETTSQALEMAPDEGIVFRDLHRALIKDQCDVSPATAFLGVLICVSESGANGPVMEISNPTKGLSLGNLVLRREVKDDLF